MAYFNKLTFGLCVLFFSQVLLSSCSKESNPPIYMISHYYIVGNDTLSKLFVPSAFTPDGDGRNDVYKPIVDGFLPNSYEFFVLEQQGNKTVYFATTPDVAWDGSWRGNRAESGTYTYLIRFIAPDNQSLEFSGSLFVWN